MSNDYWKTPEAVVRLVEQLAPRKTRAGNRIALDPFAARDGSFVQADRYLYEDRRKHLGGGAFDADWAQLLGATGLAYCNPPYSAAKLRP